LHPPFLYSLSCSQPGQTATSDVAKRDLRAELLVAEHDAKNKKRKAAGLEPLPFLGAGPAAPVGMIAAPPVDGADGAGTDAEDPAAKRRKLLAEALALDRDDEDSDDEDAVSTGEPEADGDAAMKPAGAAANADADEDEDDEDDDEDETAQLLRELEKIKRERAEEKARAAAAQNATAAADREAEIATANPLLNLAAALGADTPQGVNTTAPGTFSVKRRWDDGAWKVECQCGGAKD
jgi:protein CWC15